MNTRNMNYSSRLIEKAVAAFSTLPGIGKKSALRMVLHLVNQDKEHVVGFANSIINLIQNIQECKECHNLSDEPICDICKDTSRNRTLICLWNLYEMLWLLRTPIN